MAAVVFNTFSEYILATQFLKTVMEQKEQKQQKEEVVNVLKQPIVQKEAVIVKKVEEEKMENEKQVVIYAISSDKLGDDFMANILATNNACCDPEVEEIHIIISDSKRPERIANQMYWGLQLYSRGKKIRFFTQSIEKQKSHEFGVLDADSIPDDNCKKVDANIFKSTIAKQRIISGQHHQMWERLASIPGTNEIICSSVGFNDCHVHKKLGDTPAQILEKVISRAKLATYRAFNGAASCKKGAFPAWKITENGPIALMLLAMGAASSLWCCGKEEALFVQEQLTDTLTHLKDAMKEYNIEYTKTPQKIISGLFDTFLFGQENEKNIAKNDAEKLIFDLRLLLKNPALFQFKKPDAVYVERALNGAEKQLNGKPMEFEITDLITYFLATSEKYAANLQRAEFFELKTEKIHCPSVRPLPEVPQGLDLEYTAYNFFDLDCKEVHADLLQYLINFVKTQMTHITMQDALQALQKQGFTKEHASFFNNKLQFDLYYELTGNEPRDNPCLAALAQVFGMEIPQFSLL
jgi:hypothetical protein